MRDGTDLVGRTHQLQTVARGDVGNPPSLGRQEDRDAVECDPGGGLTDRPELAVRRQGGEPVGVSDPGHLDGQPLGCRGGEKPVEARPDHVCADEG